MVEVKYTLEPNKENNSILISFDCPNFMLDSSYFKHEYGKIEEQSNKSFKKDIFIYNNFYNVAQFCFNQVKFEYPWDIKSTIKFKGPDINEYIDKFFINEQVY